MKYKNLYLFIFKKMNPFSVSDKYENNKLKSRIQARIKRAEKARDNLCKIEEKISDKDKYITQRYQQPCALPGYVSNKTGMEKVVNRYENISKNNEKYEKILNTNIQEDKYYDNYIKNKKIEKVDLLEEKKEKDLEKKKFQKKIVKDWDEQIKTDNKKRDNIEMNYNKVLEKDKNIFEEKYNRENKIKRDKIKRNTEDYLKINNRLIEAKKERNKNYLKNYQEYELNKAKENQKEIDYINNKEKEYIKEQKAEFNRVLDEQNKEQQRKYQKLRDIEYGNF